MAGIEEREQAVQQICDELRALDSIFCGTDEFLVNGSQLDTDIDSSCRNLVEGKTKHLQLSVKISVESNSETKLNIFLCKDYPNSLPEMSILSTQLTRNTTAEIQKGLQIYAKESLAQFSEPIVLKLVEWVRVKLCENLPPDVKVDGKCASNRDDKYIFVLKFDHMRSRKKYLKTISNWMKELNLNGCIIIWEKNILEIIEGQRSDIQRFLKRVRTCTVDVDSAGRPCKERMMNVLCEMEKNTQKSIANGFQILECASLQEVEQVFQTYDLLAEIYQTFVKDAIQKTK